jgi:hypothetical protein
MLLHSSPALYNCPQLRSSLNRCDSTLSHSFGWRRKKSMSKILCDVMDINLNKIHCANIHVTSIIMPSAPRHFKRPSCRPLGRTLRSSFGLAFGLYSRHSTVLLAAGSLFSPQFCSRGQGFFNLTTPLFEWPRVFILITALFVRSWESSVRCLLGCGSRDDRRSGCMALSRGCHLHSFDSLSLF